MAKRLSSKPSAIDIFTDERLDAAMAAATAPAPAYSEPEPVQPRKADNVLSMPGVEAVNDTRRLQAAVEERTRAATTPTPAADAALEPESNVSLKFKVPQTMKGNWGTFLAELSSILGVHLEDSNVGRAMVEILLVDDQERVLEVAAGSRGRLKRPHKGDLIKMAEFDQEIGEIFREARKRRRGAPKASE